MSDSVQSHIKWRRLKVEEPRGKRQGPVVLPKPPLRPERKRHGEELTRQTNAALQEADRERAAIGVDPARLLVLEMGFAEGAPLDLIEKLGLTIIDEETVSTALEQPFYAARLTFDRQDQLEAFSATDLTGIAGLLGVTAVRGPGGEPHPNHLEVRFADRDAAKRFAENTELASSSGFTVSGAIRRVGEVKRYRLIVQFPSIAERQRFLQEEQAYQDEAQNRVNLAPGERLALFDALEAVRALTPADRTGERLRTEGAPDKETFLVDVDLWHPGSPTLVSTVIREFRAFVQGTGGTVTDGPTTVADSLLLARARVTPRGLESLLHHDQVALVDLPPRGSEVRFSIFRDVPAPELKGTVPADGPRACVVDSGVVPGHPLLQGLVDGARDFDTGDGTEVDLAGHGTHVAGIVVYGDIVRCLDVKQWTPHVRILNAKVLRNDNGIARFPEEDERRSEFRLAEAITSFAREYGCRVFNLSLGHDTRQYAGGRQLPWALLLDELARSLDIVIVVAAGNMPFPAIPSEEATSPAFQHALREQLLTPAHAVTDPASALNALTVGAVARGDLSRIETDNPERRYLAGAPCHCPAPYTRTGNHAEFDGAGAAIKPELVAFGGNYCLAEGGRTWNKMDANLGEPSLRHDFQTSGRLLSAGSGTSMAAPFVTHVCARIEERLRKDGIREKPTANLIRALAVHSAQVHPDAGSWIGEESTPGEALVRRLRLLGYGMPDVSRALFSSDQHVVLVAEDELPDGVFHLYELEVPPEFLSLNSKRWIRVTLAYDPPVKGTRKEYLRRKLFFRLTSGQQPDEIIRASTQGRDLEQPDIIPAYQTVKNSTVQSVVFEGTRGSRFGQGTDPEAPTVWHILVRSELRLETEGFGTQRYALVASLEHTDAEVRLYQKVRLRVENRIRTTWGG